MEHRYPISRLSGNALYCGFLVKTKTEPVLFQKTISDGISVNNRLLIIHQFSETVDIPLRPICRTSTKERLGFQVFREGRGYGMENLFCTRYGWNGDSPAIGGVLRALLNGMGTR
jgi:hypothetical protein